MAEYLKTGHTKVYRKNCRQRQNLVWMVKIYGINLETDSKKADIS